MKTNTSAPVVTDEARQLYEQCCKSFIASGGDRICFGRLEGMQVAAKSLGLGDCFKDIRDRYMAEFEKLTG
jgi:hypothetical protein